MLGRGGEGTWMSRRAFLAAGAVFLAAPVAAEAQQAAKVYRIGYLAQGSGSGAASLRPLEGFRQGLRELGWVEGQNTFSSSIATRRAKSIGCPGSQTSWSGSRWTSSQRRRQALP